MENSAKQAPSFQIDQVFTSESETPDALDLTGIWDLLARYGLKNLAYGGDVGRNPGYIFRGEIEYKLPLKTGLERKACKQHEGRITPAMLQQFEQKLIAEYLQGEGRQLATIIDAHVRSQEAIFWWLSLMQHYRQPTRFIDFTKDIRIALFFALEHFSNWQTEKRVPLQAENLVIYCFPCRDPKYPSDPDHNKTPYDSIDKGIDMNLALGGQIGLDWMLKRHGNDFKETYLRKNQRSWGWDRPYYENPRLRFQKGMFVYPFDEPKTDLLADGESWLVGQLREGGPKVFGESELPSKLLRIPFKHADSLRKDLENRFKLTPATVYVSPDLVKLRSCDSHA